MYSWTKESCQDTVITTAQSGLVMCFGSLNAHWEHFLLPGHSEHSEAVSAYRCRHGSEYTLAGGLMLWFSSFLWAFLHTHAATCKRNRRLLVFDWNILAISEWVLRVFLQHSFNSVITWGCVGVALHTENLSSSWLGFMKWIGATDSCVPLSPVFKAQGSERSSPWE